MADCDWFGHKFTILPHDSTWHDVPGVYIFASYQQLASGSRRWSAIYVGETASFAARIPNHEAWLAARSLGASDVHAMVVQGADQRRAIEEYLIAKCQPQLNTQHRR